MIAGGLRISRSPAAFEEGGDGGLLSRALVRPLGGNGGLVLDRDLDGEEPPVRRALRADDAVDRQRQAASLRIGALYLDGGPYQPPLTYAASPKETPPVGYNESGRPGGAQSSFTNIWRGARPAE